MPTDDRDNRWLRASVDAAMGPGYFDAAVMRRLQQEQAQAGIERTKAETAIVPSKGEAALLRAQAAGESAGANVQNARTRILDVFARNSSWGEEGPPPEAVTALSRASNMPEEDVRAYLTGKNRVAEAGVAKTQATTGATKALGTLRTAQAAAVPEKTAQGWENVKAAAKRAEAALSQARIAAKNGNTKELALHEKAINDALDAMVAQRGQIASAAGGAGGMLAGGGATRAIDAQIATYGAELADLRGNKELAAQLRAKAVSLIPRK